MNGLAAYALLCSSHQGLRPCLRIWINFTAAGILMLKCKRVQFLNFSRVQWGLFHIWIFVCTQMIYLFPAFSSGFHEEEPLSGENGYNDKSENRLNEHGSGLELSISTSMSVEVCYQGPDFSGSKELTFTLPSSDDHTTQVALCSICTRTIFKVKWSLWINAMNQLWLMIIDFGGAVGPYKDIA